MTNTSSTWYKADFYLIVLDWLLELLANIAVSSVFYTLKRAMHNTPGRQKSSLAVETQGSGTITCVLDILKIDITSILFHRRLSLSCYKINHRTKRF